MSAALLLDAGGGLRDPGRGPVDRRRLARSPTPSQALTRWTDALVGGAVALVAATVVPSAPLRQPGRAGGPGDGQDRRPAARRGPGAARRGRRGAARPALGRPHHRRADRRADRRPRARGSRWSRSSPFRVRHRRERPQDVGAGGAAGPGAAQHPGAGPAGGGGGVPARPACRRRTRRCAWTWPTSSTGSPRRCAATGTPSSSRATWCGLAEASSRVERTDELSAEVVLAQLRSIIADLLRITGMGSLEATDAIPPLARD